MNINERSTALDSGTWNNKIRWELYAGLELPPVELCTAAFCLAIDKDDKVVLMRAKRGWSLLGGHIEEGETVEEAVTRESQEEGGFTPDQLRQFAFRKIISTEPIPHQDPSKMYPYPISYNVFYWATTKRSMVLPTGIEVLETGSFRLREAIGLNPAAKQIIKYGYNVFLRQKV